MGSPFASGNCANWQGYFSRVFSTTNILLTRSIQQSGATISANQDLVGNGVTGGFSNQPPVTLGQAVTPTVTISDAAYYTISYTILLTDTNTPTLAFTNILYSGAGTNGTVLSTASATATGTNYLTNSFDGLSFGRRDTAGTATLVTMVITNVTVTANISTFPGQPFDVTGGGIGCINSSSFQVGLDGSVANNDYYLYTNGVWTGVFQHGTGSALSLLTENVVAVPLTNTVTASNIVSGATGQMLGSALVGPENPPSITNQPSSTIVANGSIAVFSVGASGGGLTYQWYKNSLANPLSDGGNITGSTSSTLVISPAGSGDAASYFVVVTSGCNATAQSSPASLTIGAAANITWQGNNPNSNWDMSTTANFLNGSPVVFHNGDNVTFGGSPATFTVNVTGNFIAPGSMTDNAGSAYTFNGPGVIQGPGNLVLNGGSSLIINNSNAYTGGTTVTSGTLVLSNGSFFPVGTGPITLAGGTLDIPIKGSSAVGLSNNINISASSTLQFEQTATFACVLNGAITGNPGAVWTVNAAEQTGTATARLRMYGAFTNNADVILLSGGQAEIEFAPYLPATNNVNGGAQYQVFNGVISGSGGHIVPRGAGTVILNNAANTFNDTVGTTPVGGVSLLMSSGNVGIGANSVQSSPPTIDSSPVGVGLVAINVGTEGGDCSFQASGGSHTIANQVIYTSATNTVTIVFGGTNNLTFSGEFDLANPQPTSTPPNPAIPYDVSGTNRTLDVTNRAATTLSGVISDNGNTSGLTKNGTGSLYLNGTNIYTGPTTNNSGLLAGSGSIAGPVIIGTNGSSASIGGGSAASIGTLTVSNSLTLNANVSIRVNKSLSPSQSNDVISVTGSIVNSGTGTVTVNNLGPALAVGDTFQIFNKGVSGGNSLTVTGGSVTWNNNLQGSGTISVASISPTGPTTNATITKVLLSGTNVVVVGTNNNVPNTSFRYAVVTSTNIATPLSNWSAVVTNPFNSDGTFDYTNPIVPGYSAPIHRRVSRSISNASITDSHLPPDTQSGGFLFNDADASQSALKTPPGFGVRQPSGAFLDVRKANHQSQATKNHLF